MNICKLFPSNINKLTTVARIIISISIYMLIPMAHANWQVDWEAGVFLEYTDNVLRSDTDKQDDYVIEPRGSISATHLGPKFDAEISADNEYRGYSEGTIGNRNDFNLDAMLDWKIIPELFFWNIEDHFSTEFPIEVRDSPNQRNQQDVNTFVTGPTFTPRIFSNTSLNLEGRYINTQAESSNIDNDRLQGLVGIIRDLNPLSSISLNYSAESVKFNGNTPADPTISGNIDFNRYNYYAQYNLTRQSFDLTVQVGYTNIDRDSGPNKSSDGGNNSLDLNYTINSTSSLGLNVYDEFSDTSTDSLNGGAFGLGGGFGGIGGNVGGSLPSIGGDDNSFGDIDLSVTGDTVDAEGGSLRYMKDFSKLGTSFEIFTRKEDYSLVDVNDREVDGALISLSWAYNNRTKFELSSEYRETDFDFDNRNDDDFLIELSSDYYYTRNWRFESSIDYRERDSSVQTSDFDVYEIRVGVVYSNF